MSVFREIKMIMLRKIAVGFCLITVSSEVIHCYKAVIIGFIMLITLTKHPLRCICATVTSTYQLCSPVQFSNIMGFHVPICGLVLRGSYYELVYGTRGDYVQ